MADTLYLEKHGTKWRVKRKFPVRHRGTLGLWFVARLGTESLSAAQGQRWKHIVRYQQIVDQADAAARGDVSSLIEEALECRKVYEEAKENPLLHADQDNDGPMVIHGYISDKAIELSEDGHRNEASLFYGIATGTATPVGKLIETWSSELRVKPRQLLQYRRTAERYLAWAGEAKEPITVEQVDRRSAGRYVSTLIASGMHRKTINSRISCLSSFWKWLEVRGYVSSNVWSKQSVPKHDLATHDDGKRPLTDEEVKKLLAGDAPTLLKDFMVIAALSAMRIEEIASLRVADVVFDHFEIRVSKTKAGRRKVPIHSDLISIIDRRTSGANSDTYLFSELPERAPGSKGERSQPVSKKFTRYRRNLGVDDVVEGVRQSRIDFHSFRRWFATKATEALVQGGEGFNEWTLADVMGHARESMPLAMTMGRYAGPSTFEAKRACVEAVKLPQ